MITVTPPLKKYVEITGVKKVLTGRRAVAGALTEQGVTQRDVETVPAFARDHNVQQDMGCDSVGMKELTEYLELSAKLLCGRCQSSKSPKKQIVRLAPLENKGSEPKSVDE